MGDLYARAWQLKEKRSGYGALLDFYVQVREAQTASRTTVKVPPLPVNEERQGPLAAEGFPLGRIDDFPIDREAAMVLFRTFCQLGRTANPHMAEQLEKIYQALADNVLALQDLLTSDGRQAIGRTAAEFGLDRQVLSFLVQSSIRPSIEAGMERLRGRVDLEGWRKNQCPVCGSAPALCLLKGEGGKRYSLCSGCGCQWRIDRLSCAVCGDQEQASRHYFCGEGEEAWRIDLCEACRHYVKTLDFRALEETDPTLEDLASLHLDYLAVRKGYKRAVPSPWIADNPH